MINTINTIVIFVCVGVIIWILYRDSFDAKIKQIINRHSYIWQDECDMQCAKVVGEKDMKTINEAGCVDLNMYIPLDKEHVAALNDKINYIPCENVPKKNLNPEGIDSSQFKMMR